MNNTMGKKAQFLTGVAIGAGVGVLFAPKPGAETRAELAEKIKILLDKIKEEMAQIEDFDDIEFNLEDKIIDIKNDLAALDKAKIKTIAKEQAKNIKNKTEEIYEIAKAKGTPIVQKTANDVRKKSSELLRTVADNIETKDKPNKKTEK